MKRKQILETLKELNCDELTYQDIKTYLSLNNWKLKDISAIEKSDSKNHCKVYVLNTLIGTF